MKIWKMQQEIYHKLNQYHDDDLSLYTVEITDNIIRDAIKYFTTTELGWVYPAKSYVVGICYAKWLTHYFAEDFYEALNDPNLLFDNDPYFVPYEKEWWHFNFKKTDYPLSDFQWSCHD